ncbi:MAG: penicillin-binding protein [Oscillospiraceae bacterium]|nr:penicillin-binding protein [Oscillospiraceae bacterium]
MNRIALRAYIVILVAVLLLGGFSFFLFEYATQAEDWVIQNGSPHVYDGGNIATGVVTDREGVLLLDMTDGRKYSSSEAVRKTTVHWVGDRYGSVNAPALSHYSTELTGFDMLTGTYKYGENGGVARLTLSSKVQTAALEALGEYKGTVGVYNYKTGELICAVTTPGYDPDNVPTTGLETGGPNEGIYVNRFTQSVYIPGSIFKVVTLAAALETIPDVQEQKFTCTGEYKLGSKKITCEEKHGNQDLKMAFRNSCNCAFAEISQQLGADTLERFVEQFGVTKSVQFDGITTKAGNYDLEGAMSWDIAWSSIGQYTDQVNPCTFLTFMGAIAGDGQGVTPYLVEKITCDSTVTYAAKTETRDRIMSASTAKVLQEYLGFNVENKYGSDKFPGMTVCGKTGTGEVGGNKKPNAMFVGFVEDAQYPLAFIVAVEDGGYGVKVSVPIAAKVLAACKEALDK